MDKHQTKTSDIIFPFVAKFKEGLQLLFLADWCHRVNAYTSSMSVDAKKIFEDICSKASNASTLKSIADQMYKVHNNIANNLDRKQQRASEAFIDAIQYMHTDDIKNLLPELSDSEIDSLKTYVLDKLIAF